MPFDSSPIQTYPATNYAPVKPLLRLANTQKAEPHSLNSAIKELFQDCLKRDEALWNDIADKTLLVAEFIQGKKSFGYNSFQNRYMPVRRSRSNPNETGVINLMQYYATQNIRRITASNPDLEPADVFLRPDYEEKVKVAKAVWNYYESRFYNPTFSLTKALHLIHSGTFIEALSYDPSKQSAMVFKDIFGEVEIEISAGQGRCYECEFSGVEKDFEQVNPDIAMCPNCQSAEVTVEPSVRQLTETVVGRQPQAFGDLVLDLYPIQACRFNAKAAAEDSSWFIYRQKVSGGKIKMLLGDIVIEGGSQSDRGLDTLDEISKSTSILSSVEANGVGTRAGGTTTIGNREHIIESFSIAPEDYQDIMVKGNEATVSGEKLPTGAKMIELFPDGCTVLGINGMEIIYGIYPIHHSKLIASSCYHSRYNSGTGRGMEDTVEIQRRFNKRDNQMDTYLDQSATPGKTYIEGAIDQKHIKSITRPDAVIPIKKAVLAEIGNRQVIEPIAAGVIHPAIMQYVNDYLGQYRQLTSHITENVNGVANINNNTATAAAITKDNAESLFSPMLMTAAQARKRTARNTLFMYRELFTDVSRYFSFSSGKYKTHKGGLVKGSEIDPEIEFVVVRDSEAPKTRTTKQIDTQNFMLVVGGAQGLTVLMQTDSKLVSALAKTYDVDLDLDTYDEIKDICKARLEMAMSLGKQIYAAIQSNPMAAQVPIEQILSPEMILQEIDQPVEVFESEHIEKAKWFSEYLDSAEGFALNAMERALVGGLIRAHYTAQATQEAEIALLAQQAQMAATEPMRRQQMQDAQMQQGQAAEQQNAQLEANNAAEVEKEQMKADNAETAKQADFDRNQENMILQSELKQDEMKAQPKAAKA